MHIIAEILQKKGYNILITSYLILGNFVLKVMQKYFALKSKLNNITLKNSVKNGFIKNSNASFLRFVFINTRISVSANNLYNNAN